MKCLAKTYSLSNIMMMAAVKKLSLAGQKFSEYRPRYKIVEYK